MAQEGEAKEGGAARRVACNLDPPSIISRAYEFDVTFG